MQTKKPKKNKNLKSYYSQVLINSSFSQVPDDRYSLFFVFTQEPGYCNTVDMLTSNLMVTGGQGCLHLWDVSKGEVLRAVPLGDSNPSVFIRHLRVIANSTVVCDYGNQLRVIYFPAVLEKFD